MMSKKTVAPAPAIDVPVMVKIADLIPYINNAKRHTPEQVTMIAASIKEFGFRFPVYTDAEGVIVVGHGRVQAAEKLGMSEVPVVKITDLSPAKIKSLRLAENRLAALTGIDPELAKMEIEALRDDFGMEDFDAVGYDAEALSELFLETEAPTEGQTDPDAVPEPPKVPVSVKGDVWLLGKHRVMCGDSTVITDVERLMDGKKADMVFTDPPWNVNYGAVEKGNKQGYKPRKIMNDHMDEDSWAAFVAAFVAACSKGTPVYFVMSPQEWPSVDNELRKYFHWSSTIIWAKDALVLSRKDYHTQYEPIWYGWRNDGPRRVELKDRKQSDLWNIARPRNSELHPTMKPIELVERAVNNSSLPGSFVLDLFGGSGSTLIACEKTGRVCRMMELDPLYVDVIVKRWQDFTGKQATHEETGRVYDELKNEGAK